MFVLIWIVFIDAGYKTEWYVEFYSDGNTIHKCARDKYNEYTEMLNINNLQTEKEQKNYYRILFNESKYYTKSHQK